MVYAKVEYYIVVSFYKYLFNKKYEKENYTNIQNQGYVGL